MNTHDKYELPPLPKYTLLIGLHTSENMQRYARAAIAPYQQRIAELESQLEAIGAGGVDGRRLIGDSCHQRIEELEAELQELQRQWVEHDTLGCPTAKTGIYASKADRQRRGEPVAWIRKNGFRFIAEVEPQDDSEVPLYAAPQPAESHVDRANRIVDSWPEWKKNYALTKHDVKATQSAEPVDISAFDEMIDLYQDAQRDGTFKERTKARAALKEAYRKALAQPAEPVKVPSDDVLADALTNLEHHNYERSYSGYKNRQADVELIRAALAAMEQQT